MSPTVLKHMETVYKFLDKQGKDDVIDGTPVRVFVGGLTVVLRAAGVSAAYYSKVYRGLERLGSITIVERGGRGNQSVVVLHRPPDAELYAAHPEPLTQRPDVAILAQRVSNLEASQGGLHLAEALADLQKQVSALRKEVNALKKGLK